MPSLDFDKEVHNFRGFYADNRHRFESAATLFVSLIISLTASVDGLEAPTVNARVKDLEECINNFPDYEFDGFDVDIFVHEINCWRLA